MGHRKLISSRAYESEEEAIARAAELRKKGYDVVTSQPRLKRLGGYGIMTVYQVKAWE